MPSIIKVDQIQSDLGTVNVSSNLQFSSGFTMLSPSLSSPTLTTPTTSGVMTLGAGIKFPATQVADSDANTLDDYEEGAWTPTYYGASSTGTTTYVNQTGSYVKVGSIVTIQMFLTLTAATGTGAIRIGGLPFSIGTVSGGSAPIMVEQYNWSAGTYLVAYLETGQSFLRVFACADDAAWSEQSVTNETQSWVISVSYRTT